MTETYLKNSELDGESFYFPGNSTSILLLHGFTATTTEVRILGDHLYEQGYTVSAPLLPGHGTHPDELNQKVWMNWYEAAEAAFLKLWEHSSQVFIGGESMGALLSLLIASRYHKVDGVMLFSPALKVNKLWAAYIARYFKKYLVKNQKEDGLAWKGYTVYPLKAAVQLLKLQNIVKKELINVTQPTLIFMGKKDSTIAPDSGMVILQNISAEDKQLLSMQQSPHCMLLAGERERIFADVDAFLQAHTTAAP